MKMCPERIIEVRGSTLDFRLLLRIHTFLEFLLAEQKSDFTRTKACLGELHFKVKMKEFSRFFTFVTC
eukprot:UN09236